MRLQSVRSHVIAVLKSYEHSILPRIVQGGRTGLAGPKTMSLGWESVWPVPCLDD